MGSYAYAADAAICRRHGRIRPEVAHARRSEEEIKVLMEHLVHHDAIMADILSQLESTIKGQIVSGKGSSTEQETVQPGE